MKIEMINLVEFFDDKYRYYDNKLGICATGIITENQMITRCVNLNKLEKTVGSHFEAEGSIFADVFGFDKELFQGYGYNKALYNKLDNSHKKVLGEVIVIKYINNSAIGNAILMYLPIIQKTITERQLEAIKYMNNCIKEASRKINKPIKITATDRLEKAVEINSLKNKIIPFFEKHIDNTYKQSMQEENIIAKNDIKQLIKRF